MLGGGMRPFRNNIFAAVIILLALVALLLANFERLAVYAVARIYQLDVSYKSMKHPSLNEIDFRDARIAYSKLGFGLLCDRAVIRTAFAKKNLGEPTISLDLSGVRFMKQGTAQPPAYDSLAALVATPFSEAWSYKKISGVVRLFDKGFEIEDFVAVSQDVKLAVKGSVSHSDIIDLDIVVYFSDKLTKKVPEELSNAALREEADGWKSLAVRLKGNYRTPSMQLSGRLFRLNISEASGG
jgi:hypothetical protein